MADGNRRFGALRERMHLQARGSGDDGLGTTGGVGAFETRSTVRAHLRPLRGGEPVIGARLQGQQPYVMTVRQTPATRQMTEAWQVVDAADATRVFAITAPPVDPDGRNRWLELMLVERGRS